MSRPRVAGRVPRRVKVAAPEEVSDALPDSTVIGWSTGGVAEFLAVRLRVAAEF